MSVCVECGFEFNVPFFIKVFKNPKICPNCVKIKQNKIQQYVSKIREFGADNYLDAQEEKALNELKESLGLSESDLKVANILLNNLKVMTKKANIKAYEMKLREVGEDNYLTEEEENELIALRKKLNLSEADVSHTLKNLIVLKKFTSIQDGNLPILQTNLLLKKNEVCHYQGYFDLMEQKSKTSYVGGSRGVSFRIAKGVSYRVGAFKGDRITEVYNDITDTGILCITNQRIIFSGNIKNITYSLKKIVNMVTYKDGIQFQKENETKPKYFINNNSETIDEVAMIASRLISGV